jgi:hypothetical protein
MEFDGNVVFLLRRDTRWKERMGWHQLNQHFHGQRNTSLRLATSSERCRQISLHIVNLLSTEECGTVETYRASSSG